MGTVTINETYLSGKQFPGDSVRFDQTLAPFCIEEQKTIVAACVYFIPGVSVKMPHTERKIEKFRNTVSGSVEKDSGIV